MKNIQTVSVAPMLELIDNYYGLPEDKGELSDLQIQIFMAFEEMLDSMHPKKPKPKNKSRPRGAR